jgi:pimeloyl-ACP methyl ester carboxylesterase
MTTDHELITAGAVRLEVIRSGATARLCAAHPADTFTGETAALLTEVAGQPVVCVNPPGLGGSTGALRGSLEQVVDDLEAARQALGGPRWVFWGLSGGGWLGQLWAHRHPEALAGLIVESVCANFRARLADPSCALSPSFPAWRQGLQQAGLLGEGSLDAAEWVEVEGVGAVLRGRGGPAVLVSPMPPSPAMKEVLPLCLGFDARPWLSKLRLPTLVLAGTADPVVPVGHVRAIHQAIPGSTFVALDGAGHVPSAQRDPRAISAVQAWLRGLG